MRIVHLNTERTWRGGERQTLWLARELERRGHQNRVACRPGFPLERAAKEAGLKTFALSPWAEAAPLAAWRLRRFLKESGAEVLHAHTAHAVGLGALAARGIGVKFAATRRVDFPLQRNFFSRWKYGRLDGLAAISRRVRDVLVEGGMPADRVVVISSGIDAAGYPSAADRVRLRREKGCGEGDFLIVNAAALVPHKDHDTLLRAARLVCAEIPRARFLILGDGPLKGRLTETARSLGLEGRAVFLGHRADVLEWTALADVFVLSSEEEGLGTALLDAMALGVPTVATRAGGIPDIYGSEQAPELVSPKDPEALAGALLSLARDPEEGRRRAARGRDLVSRFTVRAMTDRYEDFYKKLLQSEK